MTLAQAKRAAGLGALEWGGVLGHWTKHRAGPYSAPITRADGTQIATVRLIPDSLGADCPIYRVYLFPHQEG